MRHIPLFSILRKIFSCAKVSHGFLLAPVISACLFGSALAGPWILLDAKSGKLIAQHQATRPAHPASITKLMTVYTVLRRIKSGTIELNSPVRVSTLALSMPPSKMGFPVGTIMTVDTAIKIIMVKSANDIATALAQSTSGNLSAFVREMNENARRIGMLDSNFDNPHGLHSPTQVTTAKDMALLTLRLQQEFPEHAGYFNISAIRFGKVRMKNHNALISRVLGTNGMKTGYTCASGLNIVARAQRGDKSLIVVVLGGYSSVERNILAAQLLESGFKDRFSFSERPHVNSLKAGTNIYAVPQNLKPTVCQPSWSERQQSKKQRRAARRAHLANLDKLRKIHLSGSVKTNPTLKIVLGGAIGKNPFKLKTKNGSTPTPVIALPVWRPDRASAPDA